MEHTRYTRICFEALRERAHEGVAKYNWVTQVQDLLDSLGYYGLCMESEGSLFNDLKQDIMTTYKIKRQQDDITKMRSSHNFCYYEELLSDSNEHAQYINFNLPKWEFALCAQMRITNRKFYLDKKTLSLDEDKSCPLCNKGSFDIFHIIYDCKILGGSRNLWIRDIIDSIGENNKHKCMEFTTRQNCRQIACFMREVIN